MTSQGPDLPAGAVTAAAWGRARGLSRETVSHGRRQGRLATTAVKVGRVWWVTDPAAADREWDASTDLSTAPMSVLAKEAARAARCEAVATATTYLLPVEAAREKHWRANLAELEYRTRARELIPAAEVADAYAEAVTVAKTRILGVPVRIKQQLPHLTTDDVRAIDDLLREALEDLAALGGAAADAG